MHITECIDEQNIDTSATAVPAYRESDLMCAKVQETEKTMKSSEASSESEAGTHEKLEEADRCSSNRESLIVISESDIEGDRQSLSSDDEELPPVQQQSSIVDVTDDELDEELDVVHTVPIITTPESARRTIQEESYSTDEEEDEGVGRKEAVEVTPDEATGGYGEEEDQPVPVICLPASRPESVVLDDQDFRKPVKFYFDTPSMSGSPARPASPEESS